MLLKELLDLCLDTEMVSVNPVHDIWTEPMEIDEAMERYGDMNVVQMISTYENGMELLKFQGGIEHTEDSPVEKVLSYLLEYEKDFKVSKLDSIRHLLNGDAVPETCALYASLTDEEETELLEKFIASDPPEKDSNNGWERVGDRLIKSFLCNLDPDEDSFIAEIAPSRGTLSIELTSTDGGGSVCLSHGDTMKLLDGMNAFLNSSFLNQEEESK